MFKSPFERFISTDSLEDNGQIQELSQRIVTIPTAMTASRPALALKATDMLIDGRQLAIIPTALMALSDMEGKVGRYIDKTWPDSGLGCSVFGEKIDPVADALALMILGGGIILAPRIPIEAKAGVCLVMGQEATKAIWALETRDDFMALTGKELQFPPSLEGKAAMAEKMSAFIFAVLSHETDNPIAKHGFAIGSLAVGATGAVRGHQVVEEYKPMVQELMSNFHHNSDGGLLLPNDV